MNNGTSDMNNGRSDMNNGRSDMNNGTSDMNNGTSDMNNGKSDMNNGVGGKRRRRRMCGGYSSNMSLTNLASSAAPISGVQTASSSFVGGKTKRRRHRHTKSCKKSCRKR